MRYLALLRGINVGGKNVISKDDLRQCFEDLGLTAVRTYIQSGNILFRSESSSVKELTAAIETGLSTQFSYDAQAVIFPHRRYKAAIAAAPAGWGVNDGRKHNALFALAGCTPKEILKQLPVPKSDIETVTAGRGVIFWSFSKKEQSKTTMMKVAKSPTYQQMTVRNHNTVFKLLELFEEI